MGGAASGAKLPESRSALSGIQERIRELQKEIDETEESRSELATALAAAGRALSEQGRALSETRRARERMDREIRRLESEEEALQLQVSRRRQQLAEWLRRHYREGRDARLAEACEAYVRQLEALCLTAPLQWFNFFDFWRPDHASAVIKKVQQ